MPGVVMLPAPLSIFAAVACRRLRPRNRIAVLSPTMPCSAVLRTDRSCCGRACSSPANPMQFPRSPSIDCFNKRRMRSEEHTSELQSLMRISYAVFCLKKKQKHKQPKYKYRNRKVSTQTTTITHLHIYTRNIIINHKCKYK